MLRSTMTPSAATAQTRQWHTCHSWKAYSACPIHRWTAGDAARLNGHAYSIRVVVGVTTRSLPGCVAGISFDGLRGIFMPGVSLMSTL